MGNRSGLPLIAAAPLLAVFLGVVLATAPALALSPTLALSDVTKEQIPSARQAQPPLDAIPLPGQMDQTSPSGDDDVAPGDDEPEQVEPATPVIPDVLRPRIDPNAPLPEVFHDLDKLPEPVRHMHDLLVEACKSGDIEKLRPLIEMGADGTQLSLGAIDGDPIAFLHGLSGDEGGQEILAILEEILDAGYVHTDAGKPEELYVWPYFYAIPLDRLDIRQRVELFRIITAGDYEDMKTFDAYIFYRVGITPQGKWAFFVAGD